MTNFHNCLGSLYLPSIPVDALINTNSNNPKIKKSTRGWNSNVPINEVRLSEQNVNNDLLNEPSVALLSLDTVSIILIWGFDLKYNNLVQAHMLNRYH